MIFLLYILSFTRKIFLEGDIRDVVLHFVVLVILPFSINVTVVYKVFDQAVFFVCLLS